MLVVAAVAEASLRSIPGLMPAGVIGALVYDPDLGLRVHGAPVIYNKTRFLRRAPNGDGFMDVDHARAKPTGTVRVGFFGDSYVEAVQVPLEAAFFRRLPRRVNGVPIEPLAFGISGWGTLHSLMAYRTKGPEYDLDIVIYVFVSNDPGDQSYAFGSGGGLPAAVVADNDRGYDLQPVAGADTFVRQDRNTLARRLIDGVLTRSLFAQLVHSRLNLLVIQMRGTAGVDDPGDRANDGGRRADGARGTGSSKSAVAADKNDPPSRWPAAVRRDTERLAASILADFSRTVRTDGRELIVFYVPSGEAEVSGTRSVEATWYPWLAAACEELGIPVIDPRPAMRARHAAGEPIFDDHFTEAGHEVAAQVIAGFLAERLAR